jgi:ribosome biogenesis protein YTM1
VILSTCVCFLTRQSAAEKPFLSLIATDSGLPFAVLALSTDRSMTLYDLSSSSSSASASFMHPATPSCVALGRGSGMSQQVVTGAYDGVVRVWDLRSTKSAVASFRAWDGGKKVLGVDWDMGVGGKGVVGVAGEGGLEVWGVGWADGDQENKV